MSEEEKKAIEKINYISDFIIENGQYNADVEDIKFFSIILNLISKLQADIEIKDKVIDLTAFEIAEDTGSCPLDIYDWENKKYDNCNNCNDTYKECFIEYFYKKVEE